MTDFNTMFQNAFKIAEDMKTTGVPNDTDTSRILYYNGTVWIKNEKDNKFSIYDAVTGQRIYYD